MILCYQCLTEHFHFQFCKLINIIHILLSYAVAAASLAAWRPRGVIGGSTAAGSAGSGGGGQHGGGGGGQLVGSAMEAGMAARTRTNWFWMVLSSGFPEPKSAKKRWECESKWRGRREVGVEIGDGGR